MAKNSPKRHGNWELSLQLKHEEALTHEDRLENGDRTATVRVLVRYEDQNGTTYVGDRVVKVKVKKESQ